MVVARVSKTVRVRELLPVRIIISEDARPGIYDAAKLLAARGMAVCRINPETGVLSEHCEAPVIGKLREVSGVRVVETKVRI